MAALRDDMLKPVQEPRQLCGRDAELARLVDVLSTGSPRMALVLGEPGLGKTSLQNVALEQLRRESGREPVPVRFPAGELITSREDFAVALLRAAADLGGPATRPGTDASPAPSANDLEFADQLSHLIGSGADRIAVLHLDDLDELVAGVREEAGRSRIAALLTTLVTQDAQGGDPRDSLRLLAGMTRPPRCVFPPGWGSSFATEAAVVDLHPLQRDAADALTREMLGAVDGEALRLVDEETGRHPLLLKALLFYLLDAPGAGATVDCQRVASAAARLARDDVTSAVLERLYRCEPYADDPSRRRLLAEACPSFVEFLFLCDGVILDEELCILDQVHLDLINELTSAGYLCRLSEGGCRLCARVLLACLRQGRREGRPAAPQPVAETAAALQARRARLRDPFAETASVRIVVTPEMLRKEYASIARLQR